MQYPTIPCNILQYPAIHSKNHVIPCKTKHNNLLNCAVWADTTNAEININPMSGISEQWVSSAFAWFKHGYHMGPHLFPHGPTFAPTWVPNCSTWVPNCSTWAHICKFGTHRCCSHVGGVCSGPLMICKAVDLSRKNKGVQGGPCGTKTSYIVCKDLAHCKHQDLWTHPSLCAWAE